MKVKNWHHSGLQYGTAIATSLLVIFTFIQHGNAQSPTSILHLNENQSEYLIGRHLEYLEDPGKSLTIEQVSSPAYSAKFQPSQVNILNFGLKDSSYWVRFTVFNDARPKQEWLLELARPSMNTVSFYTPQPEGSFSNIVTGYVHGFSTRELPYENFVFRLEVPSGQQQTYYLHLQDMALSLPLRIWANQAYLIHAQRSNIKSSLLFGALLALLIYHLLRACLVREPGAIYFICFQLCHLVLLTSIQGYNIHYLRHIPSTVNQFIIPLSITLSVSFQLLFTLKFLHQAPIPGGLSHFGRALVVILMVLSATTFFFGARTLVLILPLVILTYSFSFFYVLLAVLRKYLPARYYLASWSVYLLLSLVAAFHFLGWITFERFTPEYAIQLGSVFMITVQSLALADRVNFFKQENIKVYEKLVHEQNEKLNLQYQLNFTLEEARQELEKRISQRLDELYELNLVLSNEIIKRQHTESELKVLASTDALTGLPNRRHFFELAYKQFAEARRYQRPISIVIIDIDWFKLVNDIHGHLIGDEALKLMSFLIRQVVRESDLAARFGGEEFILLLPETDLIGAHALAERMRTLTESSAFSFEENLIKFTISLGISCRDVFWGNAETLDQLVSQADQALYKAKIRGRNRVMNFERDVFLPLNNLDDSSFTE